MLIRHCGYVLANLPGKRGRIPLNRSRLAASTDLTRVRDPATLRRRLAALLFLLWGFAHAALAAVVTASPKTQPLGTVAVPASSVASFTLSSDTNNLPITIVKDAASCANGADMEVTNPAGFPASIQSNNPLPVDVTFTPLSRGPQSCQFDVMNDAGDTLLETFSVTGTGVAPVLSLSVPSLNFGGVLVGVTKDLTFTIDNTTADAGQGLMVSSVKLVGPDYRVESGPTGFFVLQPGTQQMYTIGFQPTSGGGKAGTITFSTNDPAHPTGTVEFSGTGLARIINLPAYALIENVVAGSSGSTNVAVGNSGNTTLSVTGAALTASGDWITFVGDPPGAGCAGSKTCTFDSVLAIAANTSANVAVQCTPPPGASGSQSETLTFTSNTTYPSNAHTTVTCTVNDVIFADAFEAP